MLPCNSAPFRGDWCFPRSVLNGGNPAVLGSIGCKSGWGRSHIPGMGQNHFRLRKQRLTHSRNARAVLTSAVTQTRPISLLDFVKQKRYNDCKVEVRIRVTRLLSIIRCLHSLHRQHCHRLDSTCPRQHNGRSWKGATNRHDHLSLWFGVVFS